TRSSNNSIISIFIAQRNGFTVNTPQTMLNITIQNSNYYGDQVKNIKSDDDQVSCGGDSTVNSDNIIRATISADLFSFWTFEELRKLQEEIDRGKRIEDIIKGNENGDIIGNVPYVDPDYDAFLNNDDGDG